ncbi:Ig-like domain-containing protein [Mannheimia pernigra]|uniref:Ig-like domain-containing protein n=1 Tax=Mannheimia pernigra TaxID=111844 RepID=UPI001315DD58|nr:Ig-like domain-containing protein [Mannheimia pernigra]QHB18179.1 Ig-like domain-containing protein [Mannheimia pernigra]
MPEQTEWQIQKIGFEPSNISGTSILSTLGGIGLSGWFFTDRFSHTKANEERKSPHSEIIKFKADATQSTQPEKTIIVNPAITNSSTNGNKTIENNPSVNSNTNTNTNTNTNENVVVTKPILPVITFNKVSEDNVINGAEATQNSVTISGSVKNANINDVLTLKVGDTTLTTQIQADGRFAVTTTGAILAASRQIEASITTRDSAGNEKSATKTHRYDVVTEIAEPVITFDKVTDHNTINLDETKLYHINITGTVKHSRDKDAITIKIGDQTLTTEVVGERFSVTTSGQILAKNSKITASLTTTDIAGNKASAVATHDYQVLPVYSTKVTYPNNVLSYESNKPFDFSTLKYKLDPQAYILQNSEAKAKVITALEKYVEANPDIAAKNITDSYKVDSDGDGIIDIHDKNPKMWNVSERDLRFFATAAHSSENVNRNIFERYKDTGIDEFNKQRMSNGADIREINKQWGILKYVSTGKDLQYFIYGNGKNEDGSYQNVAIAFRGSNSSSDWQGNLNILSGKKHPQLNYIDQAAEYVAKYNPENLYATGNSLGGYLAQYFVSYTIQNNPKLASIFRHSSLFNPAVLKTDSGSPDDLKQARAKADEFVKQTITDESDLTNPVSLHKTDSYVINGEFVSSGYSFLGIKIGKLGSYENTTFFNGTGSSKDKHKMNQFYADNPQLESVFSRGYRIDTHYTDKDSDNDGLTDQQEARLGTKRNETDSDGDGFSDKLEAQLKSDPLNANAIPDFLNKINIQEVFSSIAVTIESQNSKGGSKTKEVALTASLEGGNIIYSLDPIVAAEYTSDFIL